MDHTESPNDVHHGLVPIRQATTEQSRFHFVEQSGSAKEPLARVPKAQHKKSRNGCQTCRSRRVKCDEIRPTCGNCERRQIACIFRNPGNIDADRIEEYRPPTSVHRHGRETAYESSPSIQRWRENLDVDESRARRLLELKLLHTYDTKTGRSIVFDPDDAASRAYIDQVPSLALSNDALLYSLLSFTALHLIEIDPQNTTQMRIVYHRYWHQALKAHNRELQTLGPANFNAVCITSTFIRLNAWVRLRDRTLNPYTPPMEWFQTSRGAMRVFAVAHQWMSASQHSMTTRLTKRMPFVFDEEAKFGTVNRESLLHLLGQVGDDILEHVPVVEQNAYQKTISYLGGICAAMAAQGASSEICRRLILFPYLVPAHFGELMQEYQPRALVILAYYFALLSRFRRIWWMGTAGEREVRALAMTVPMLWQPLMKWPLNVINGQMDREETD